MGASIASCFRGRNTVVPDTGEKNTTLDQRQVFAIDTMVALYYKNVQLCNFSVGCPCKVCLGGCNCPHQFNFSCF